MICPNCGAENRQAAKFCTKCARQLVELWPATVQLEESFARLHPHKKRRKSKSGAGSAWRIALFVLAGLVLATFIGWTVYLKMAPQPQSTGGDPQAAAASAPDQTTAPAGEASAAVPQTPAESAVPANGAGVAPAMPAASASDAPASVPEAAAQSPPATSPAPVAGALFVIDDDPAPNSQPQNKNKKPASPRTPVRPAPIAQQQPAPAAPPPAPASAPAPAPPPASRPAAQTALCQGEVFIALAVCLQRECSRPGMSANPQCVRMREQQQGMRQSSGDGLAH